MRSGTLKKKDREVYELISKNSARLAGAVEYHESIFGALKKADDRVYKLITKEYERLRNTIQLIAAENQCSQAVLAAIGSVVQNKTVEGFPGARFHGGSEVVDEIENLAAERAKKAFGAQYANVQPHSGTQANQIVLTALLERGDRILSLGLDQGGHLSHGAKVSFSGKFFETENYYVDKTTFLLDYDAIRQRAVQVRPRLIVCGASAYAGAIDFKKFREIADEVGAYLLADISHISGLIAAGAHQSSVDHAHFTTTSTYKPGGPRGGLILMGKDYENNININGRQICLWKHIQRTAFPGVQGTPYMNNIAAKAVFFKEVLSDEYRARQFGIIENAQRLAKNMIDLGFDVLTGGTDNHMVMINVARFRDGLTGLAAQMALEQCGIIINMNKIPYDKKAATLTSDIRLGTPIVTKNGMGSDQMDTISELIDAVLRKMDIISETGYSVDISLKRNIRNKVRSLCTRFPVR